MIDLPSYIRLNCSTMKEIYYRSERNTTIFLLTCTSLIPKQLIKKSLISIVTMIKTRLLSAKCFIEQNLYTKEGKSCGVFQCQHIFIERSCTHKKNIQCHTSNWHFKMCNKPIITSITILSENMT